MDSLTSDLTGQTVGGRSPQTRRLVRWMALGLAGLLVLVACGGGEQTADATPESPVATTPAPAPEDTPAPESDAETASGNQFAHELLEGRWVGVLVLDFYEGWGDEYLTKNYIHINLDAEFNQRFSNNFDQLEMTGHMDFVYNTPVALRTPRGMSIQWEPNTNQYSGPYIANVNQVSWHERHGRPAGVNFLDIAHITGGVTVTMTFTVEGSPPHVQVETFGPGQGAYNASDLYTLRQMSFITLEPDGAGRVIFGPSDHLKPSTTGIEDDIHGYLERVDTIMRSEPLEHGERVETSATEAIKAHLRGEGLEVDINIEPNTLLEYEQSGREEILTLMRGSIYNRVRNLSGSDIFKVQLPQAILGVRGTDFSVNVIDDNTALVRVFSGTVEVDLNGETYPLTGNQGILIKEDEDLIEFFDFDGAHKPAWWDE